MKFWRNGTVEGWMKRRLMVWMDFFAGFFWDFFSGNEVLLMDVMMVDRGFVDFREDWTWYNLSCFFLQAWWESH